MVEEYRNYSNELTDAEQRLGYIRAYVNNPDFEYAGHSSLTTAVIFRLGRGDRIIKWRRPDGVMEYSHQIFGTYGSGGQPDWRPALVNFDDAGLAIRSAQRRVDRNDPLAPRIVPGDPALPMRCPGCSHEFAVNEDHLPIGGNQTCPSCHTERSIEDFPVWNAI